jgi:transcription termination/antitermination protein NusA
MEDIKTFASSIAQIAEEKGIAYGRIIEVVETALAAAYKKDHDKKGENIIAKLDPETGETKFCQILDVVDEDMIYSEEELEELKQKKEKQIEAEEELEEEKKIRFNPRRHIMIEEAKKINPKIEVGQELKISLKASSDYGRIAAQTAKQVILQRLKEAERDAILEEFKEKEGEVVSGIVQRKEGFNIFFDLGKALGVLPPGEQIKGERYLIGQRMRLLLRSVELTTKGPLIVLSRAYPKLVTKLFEIEVPEVAAGQVEIKSIARESGFRTKIAVMSTEEGIDPIGAMVGQRGTRVMAVINSLNGEKVDIIEWVDTPETFIANSLSPAKVAEVRVEERGKATAIVPQDQLSLAIGKGGQNVRLAAKLTGWKIDIKVEGQAEPVDIEKFQEKEQENVSKEQAKERVEEKEEDNKADKKKDKKEEDPEILETKQTEQTETKKQVPAGPKKKTKAKKPEKEQKE